MGELEQMFSEHARFGFDFSLLVMLGKSQCVRQRAVVAPSLRVNIINERPNFQCNVGG